MWLAVWTERTDGSQYARNRLFLHKQPIVDKMRSIILVGIRRHESRSVDDNPSYLCLMREKANPVSATVCGRRRRLTLIALDLRREERVMPGTEAPQLKEVTDTQVPLVLVDA